MAPSKDAPRKERTKQNGADAERPYKKLDLAAPESPVVPTDPDAINASPRDPEAVKVESGDTAAAHEAHVLINSEEKILERIEAESGEDGLPTDVIAVRQAEDAAREQSGRVEVGGDGIERRALTLQTDAELVIADQAREIREARAKQAKKDETAS